MNKDVAYGGGAGFPLHGDDNEPTVSKAIFGDLKSGSTPDEAWTGVGHTGAMKVAV